MPFCKNRDLTREHIEKQDVLCLGHVEYEASVSYPEWKWPGDHERDPG